MKETFVSENISNPISKFLKRASKIEAHEVKATLSSFLFVVILMSAYYILRPVRDAMGVIARFVR